MSLKENHPLLQPVLSNEGSQLDAEGRAHADLLAAALYRNFVIMSVSFSINHGNNALKLLTLNIMRKALHIPESFLCRLL
jgi:hypothetical protein